MELLTPEQIKRGHARTSPLLMQVPAQWGSVRADRGPLPNEGFGTYRLRFRLSSETDSAETLALYMHGVATSYRLWVNGKPLAANGEVGTGGADMVPANYPKVVDFRPLPGWNELVIQVANYAQRKGGIWEGIRLGSAAGIGSERDRRLGSETFLIGSLLFMGLYHAGLYLFRRQQKSPLYFGILCIAVAARTAVMGEAVIYALFPDMPWEIGVKVEYISVFAIMMAVVLLVRNEYSAHRHAWITAVSGAVQGAFTLFVLLTPAIVYTKLMLPYQLAVVIPTLFYSLYVYVRAALQRKIGFRINLTGMAALSFSIIVDILYYNQAIPFGDLVPYGLLVFLFTQSVNLAVNFARTAREAESLSLQLRSANDTLEANVRERTNELQETNARLEAANAELSRMEQFRRRLLTDISHELGTPITSIKGFASAMMDGVVTDDYLKYARRIHDRTQLLETLIHDLTELTKLENRQAEFHRMEMELVPFFRQLYLKYELDVLDRGIVFKWEEPGPRIGGMYAEVDPFRLEQVVANLLSNAMKITPEGGEIRLSVQWAEDGKHAVIGVADTGHGIPREETERIFERFYRIRGQEAGASRGSGIGLAICKEIVSVHGGTIGVDSEPGKGSLFYFTIPASKTAAEAEKGA